jgi:hypothetical protein
MIICDKNQIECLEPYNEFKKPCPHAITHVKTNECDHKLCERFAKLKTITTEYGIKTATIMVDQRYVNHIEIKN